MARFATGRQRGFTLIEVVIAFAVLALALTFMLGTLSGSARQMRLMFFAAAHLASRSQSRARERALLIPVANSPSHLWNLPMPSTNGVQPKESLPASSSGKMCPESSATTTTPSVTFLLPSPGMTKLLNQARDLNTDGPLPSGHGKKHPVSTAQSGRSQVLLLDPAGQSHGSSRMPNISAWPNDARVCSLSQVLVRGSIPPQYYLSSTACAGTLRRAEARGKTLPEPLLRALTAAASLEQTKPVQDMSSRFSDLL